LYIKQQLKQQTDTDVLAVKIKKNPHQKKTVITAP